jgi:hypothetical protein
VNGKLLAPFPRSNNDWKPAEDTRLCHNVELTEALPARFVIGKRCKFASVQLAYRTNVGDPSFQWLSCWRPESGLDSTAAIMTTHDNVRDVENVYGVLQDCQTVLVIRSDYIADVAVDKKLTRGEADNFVRRDATVGATDPEVFWPLNRAKTRKKSGVAMGLLRSPSSVIGKKLRKQSHERSGR